MQFPETAIVSSVYFGPVSYFNLIKNCKKVIVDVHEHYIKQTYRNRCVIASANGPLNLSVPVVYSNRLKTTVKEVKIDYATNWQKIHFKSIESAYRKSPYYEFFIDSFLHFFEKKWKYLVDLNDAITAQLIEEFGLNKSLGHTDSYIENAGETTDFRNILSPKEDMDPNGITFRPYLQIFEERHGFIPNLSALDLLFNEGPNASSFL